MKLLLSVVGVAVLAGAVIGAAFGGLVTLAQWAGDGEWELT